MRFSWAWNILYCYLILSPQGAHRLFWHQLPMGRVRMLLFKIGSRRPKDSGFRQYRWCCSSYRILGPNIRNAQVCAGVLDGLWLKKCDTCVLQSRGTKWTTQQRKQPICGLSQVSYFVPIKQTFQRFMWHSTPFPCSLRSRRHPWQSL